MLVRLCVKLLVRLSVDVHDTFQQSVVAEVYVDQTVKKQRETSIIVSGLSSNKSAPNSELFPALCILKITTRSNRACLAV
jgi:hypothetical protein